MSAIIEPLDPRLLFAAGDLDASYGTAGAAQQTVPYNLYESATALQGGDRILIGGSLQITDETSQVFLERYTATGQLDSSFKAAATIPNQPRGLVAVDAIAVLPDYHFVVAGDQANGNGLLLYFTPSGKIDTAYGRNGFTRVPFEINTVAAAPDGSVYVGGSAANGDGFDAKLTKLAPNGRVDTTFADQGTFTDPAELSDADNISFSLQQIVIRNNESILLAGSMGGDALGDAFGPTVFALTASGQGVPSFEYQDGDLTYSMDGAAAYPDGSFLTMYKSQGDGGALTERIAKSDATGATGTDTTFGQNGFIDVADVTSDEVSEPTQLLLQPDGKIIVAFGGQILRYTAAGKFDKTFGNNGVVNTPDIPIGIGSDGTILESSSLYNVSTFTTSRRFTTEGPQGLLTSRDLTAPPAGAYEFSVLWRDDDGVDASSLTDGLRIVGPDGASYKAHLLQTKNGDHGSVIAIYKFAAPGGIWTSADNGTYTVRVRGRQVKDIHGASAEPMMLGTFRVAI